MSKKKSNATRRAEQLAASERAAAIRKQQERTERRRRSLWITGAVVLVLALLLGIGYAVQSARDTTGETATPPAGAVDRFALPRGENDASVTVTIFEDFMCPFCGDFEAASQDLLDELVAGGDVRVEYRPVAFLDRFSDGTEYSSRSTSALGVVLDAAGPDVALRFHDLLFENQPAEGSPGLSDDELVALAVDAGASESEVAGPIRDQAFGQWAANASDAASQEGVNSTPTVLVDGETVEFTTTDELLTGIEDAVAAAQAG